MKRIIRIIIAFAMLISAAAMADDYAGNMVVKLDPSDTPEIIAGKAASVVPSARQLEWQKIELSAFLHFGMNTFTNREWGEGTEDPKLFNPVKFDARQWVSVLKKAGFEQVIITAKHHDGFCLWPSAYTEHSVKNSPWRGGNGDVVKEVADAAREAGLKFGFYLSPWDRHEATFGTPDYSDHYMNQLRELLTGYGKVYEVWMDGACGDMDPRCKGVKYDFDRIFAMIRELQPDAVLSIYGPDARWVGNEAGKGRVSEWSVVPDGFDATAEDIGGMDKLADAAKRGGSIRWYPAQTDTSIRPGWFYRRAEDYMVKSLPQLIDIYFASVGNNSQLLLNVPPDARGLIQKNDVKRLKEFRAVLDRMFADNLAEGAAAKETAPGTTEYDLGGNKKYNILMLKEDIAKGQRVEEFCLEVPDGAEWRQVACGTTVGNKKLLKLPETVSSRVRFRILRSRAKPVISGFGLYSYDQFK